MLTKKRTQRMIMFLTVMFVCTTVYMLCPIAFAAEPDGAAAASTVMDIIYTVLKYITTIVGVIMVIVGIVGFVVSRQNENGPDEHKAVVKMAVGIVLILLFTVIITKDGLWATLTGALGF